MVGLPDDIERAIEAAKAHALAQLRAAGEKREAIFDWSNNEDGEPVDVIVTGVPRHDGFGKWRHEHLGPQYPDRYAATVPIRPSKGDDDIAVVPEPAPSEWKSIHVQVVAPNENTGDPGRVIEAEYVAVGNQVRVRYDGRGCVETFTLGDDPVVIARRLLRAKWNSGGVFYDPIRYPAGRYH